MKELNELTRRLLAEGWKPEDTPPGTRPYNDYYGGWTYTSDAIKSMVWETPCGLIAKGSHFLHGHMGYNGIDWRPENGNPVIACPVFPSEPCPLRDPRLGRQGYSLHASDVVYQCACHLANRPYTFVGSIEEAQAQIQKEADKRWELFKAEHNGRVCRFQSQYGRTTKTWRTGYNPIRCTERCCAYCNVLAKETDRSKGNVFYDIRRSWIEKGEGLFPDQPRTVVEKGFKLLERKVSLTICEAIVKYGQHIIENRISLNHHHELFFDKTLNIEVINLRVAKVNTRDIMQDLQDIANGIEVIHTVDSLKAAKEQKRTRREAAKEQRIRKVEKMILTHGWEDLGGAWKRRAEKLLDEDRISELVQSHITGQQTPARTPLTQISIFSETALSSAPYG